MNAASRIAELTAQIREANEAYHVRDAPTIDDVVYDGLVRELERLEAERPELARRDSPTRAVGATPQGRFAEVTHREPMLSLANARGPEELDAWFRRAQNLIAAEGLADRVVQFVVEPKIDGLAVSLTYEAGRLVRGATRGDEEPGVGMGNMFLDLLLQRPTLRGRREKLRRAGKEFSELRLRPPSDERRTDEVDGRPGHQRDVAAKLPETPQHRTLALRFHAERSENRNARRRCVQRVCTFVEQKSVLFNGTSTASKVGPGFQNENLGALERCGRGGRQPGQPSTHDDDSLRHETSFSLMFADVP